MNVIPIHKDMNVDYICMLSSLGFNCTITDNGILATIEDEISFFSNGSAVTISDIDIDTFKKENTYEYKSNLYIS